MSRGRAFLDGQRSVVKGARLLKEEESLSREETEGEEKSIL